MTTSAFTADDLIRLHSEGFLTRDTALMGLIRMLDDSNGLKIDCAKPVKHKRHCCFYTELDFDRLDKAKAALLNNSPENCSYREFLVAIYDHLKSR